MTVIYLLNVILFGFQQEIKYKQSTQGVGMGGCSRRGRDQDLSYYNTRVLLISNTNSIDGGVPLPDRIQ